MRKICYAVKETAMGLYSDKIFWGEAAMAFGPWALNTLYQINYGTSPVPYAEEALHLLRGPVCARVATAFMENYRGRELTAAENAVYSLAGGMIGGGLGSARELATKSIPENVIPLIAEWTPSFGAAEAARDVFCTAVGAMAEPVAAKFKGKGK